MYQLWLHSLGLTGLGFHAFGGDSLASDSDLVA